MRYILKDILDYMQGHMPTGNIYLSTVPVDLLKGENGSPYPVILLSAAGGSASKDYDLFRQVIDVEAISNKSEEALDMLQMAFTALNRAANTQTTNYYVYFVATTMGMTDLGKDANGHARFKFSVEITYR